MGTVSNKDYPDQPEVVVDHNGAAHDVKAYVYDAQGFKGVWTTDDRWIDQAQILDVEQKYSWHEGDITWPAVKSVAPTR
jgi:hypothetical protein